MRPFQFIALLMGSVFVGTCLYLAIATQEAPPTQRIVDYKDFVSILLTAITVALAVLAFGIGALAVWGYREFMNKAHESAASVAGDTVRNYLDSPAFQEALAKAKEPYYQEQAKADMMPDKEEAATDHAAPTPIPHAPQ